MDKIREAAQDYRSHIVSIMEGEKVACCCTTIVQMLIHHNYHFTSGCGTSLICVCAGFLAQRDTQITGKSGFVFVDVTVSLAGPFDSHQ